MQPGRAWTGRLLLTDECHEFVLGGLQCPRSHPRRKSWVQHRGLGCYHLGTGMESPIIAARLMTPAALKHAVGALCPTHRISVGFSLSDSVVSRLNSSGWPDWSRPSGQELARLLLAGCKRLLEEQDDGSSADQKPWRR